MLAELCNNACLFECVCKKISTGFFIKLMRHRISHAHIYKRNICETGTIRPTFGAHDPRHCSRIFAESPRFKTDQRTDSSLPKPTAELPTRRSQKRH